MKEASFHGQHAVDIWVVLKVMVHFPTPNSRCRNMLYSQKGVINFENNPYDVSWNVWMSHSTRFLFQTQKLPLWEVATQS